MGLTAAQSHTDSSLAFRADAFDLGTETETASKT
jgi:hypothetical protein